MAAAFLVPAVAGMWTEEAGDKIPHVAIGIVALGHILFGIMHRPVIAAVGAGIAVAYYVPSYLAGDAAPVVTAVAFLVVVALSAAWIRKSGVLWTDEDIVLNEDHPPVHPAANNDHTGFPARGGPARLRLHPEDA